MYKLRTVSIAVVLALLMVQITVPIAFASPDPPGQEDFDPTGGTTTAEGIYFWWDDPENPNLMKCSYIDGLYGEGATWDELKIEDGYKGYNLNALPSEGFTYENGDGLEVTLKPHSPAGEPPYNTFEWDSNFYVSAVIVKDGVQGAAIFVYNGETATWNGAEYPAEPKSVEYDVTEDQGLGTPGENNISHISFCYTLGDPPAIELASFSAVATGDSVTLSWETGAEVDNAGFNLYRAEHADGAYVKINNELIGAGGNGTGANYSYVDSVGDGSFFYKLEDVDTSGVSTVHGPVQVQVGAADVFQAQLFLPIIQGD